MCVHLLHIIGGGLMKMGNIAPGAGFKPPTLLAILGGLACYPLHYLDSLMKSPYPHLPVYGTHCLRGQCRLLHCLSIHDIDWQCSFYAYMYVCSRSVQYWSDIDQNKIFVVKDYTRTHRQVDYVQLEKRNTNIQI